MTSPYVVSFKAHLQMRSDPEVLGLRLQRMNWGDVAQSLTLTLTLGLVTKGHPWTTQLLRNVCVLCSTPCQAITEKVKNSTCQSGT